MENQPFIISKKLSPVIEQLLADLVAAARASFQGNLNGIVLFGRGVRQKSSVFKGTANGTGRANSLPSQRAADPRVPGGSAPPPIHAPRPSRLGSRAIFAVLVRVQNFQRSYLLLPTLTLVEKSSKVLPTVTYCDFGPPSLRFRLLIASAFASLWPAQRCGAPRRRAKG
jgi:hypothetical protein